MDTATQLRKFQARSMHEALARVKRELGRDAIILHTRTLRRGGLLGIGVKNWVEITATVDQRVSAIRRSAGDLTPQPLPGSFRTESAQAPATVTVEQSETSPTPLPDSVDPRIFKEIREIREMVLALASTTRRKLPRVPAQLVQFYSRLIQQQVSNELAVQILDRVGQRLTEQSGDGAAEPNWSAEVIQAELVSCIAEMVPLCQPLDTGTNVETDGKQRPRVVALVGPTGVGKTTTLAKLAANMKLREGKRVGLITIDTFRIAAIEQLKTYAEIMGVPLATVSSVDGIRQALDSMADVDVILIDTAGRSQRDEPKITELAQYLQAAAPDQVHLVLSSTSQTQTNREAIEKFSALGAQNIIFTKLDEAVGFGAMLGALASARLKLSYLTNGQSVPDDIEPASGERLARLVLGVEESMEKVAS